MDRVFIGATAQLQMIYIRWTSILLISLLLRIAWVQTNMEGCVGWGEGVKRKYMWHAKELGRDNRDEEI